eukprot:762899-Hanusia_phi.AAC.2
MKNSPLDRDAKYTIALIANRFLALLVLVALSTTRLSHLLSCCPRLPAWTELLSDMPSTPSDTTARKRGSRKTPPSCSR